MGENKFNKDIKSFSKGDIMGSMIIITVFLTIGFGFLLWLGISDGFDTKSIQTIQTILTIPAVIIGMWVYFFYQGRIDKKESFEDKSNIQKTFEVERKVTGGITRVKAVAVLLVGGLMIILGILNFFNIGSSFEMSIKMKIILSTSIVLMGIATIVVGIFLLRYSEVAIQGRLYKKEEY